MSRFLVPFALALLAGTTAEFLLGDQYLMGDLHPGHQLGLLAMFTMFYGSAALVIREVTRRTGRGWPTMIALALAFGLVEEGLLTQTLFDPHYLGFDLLDYGHVAVLGIGVPWTIFVLGLHVAWSIATPIAVAEALFPTHAGRGAAPGGAWLPGWTIAVPLALSTLGAVGTALVTWAISDHFVAHWWQLTAVVLIAATIVVLAFARSTRQPLTERLAPTASTRRILAAAGFALTVSSGFVAARQESRWSATTSVTLQLTAVLVAVVVITAVRPAPLGLAIGALATYAWVGMRAAADVGPAGVIEQSGLVVIMIGVVALAWRRTGIRAAAPTPVDRPRSAAAAGRPPAAGTGRARS